MAFAEKRKQVVLAQAVHLDISNDDHLIVLHIEERPVENFLNALPITLCQEAQCLGRVPETTLTL